MDWGAGEVVRSAGAALMAWGLLDAQLGEKAAAWGDRERSQRGGKCQGELGVWTPRNSPGGDNGEDGQAVQAGPAACGWPGQPPPAQRAWLAQLDDLSETQAPVSLPSSPKSVWWTPGNGLGATWQEKKFQP